MNKKYSFLSKNVGLFAVSSFVPKILAFLLVPIYTGYLTTSEYGVSDLITTTVSLLLPIFTLDIQDAVVRFAMDDAYDNDDVFSIALKLVLGGTGLVCLGTYAVYLMDIPGVETGYLVFFVLMYFTTALYNSVSLFCRGIDRVHTLVVGSILQSAVTLSANILCLVVFRWGLTGYLVANTVGSVVALIFCFSSAKLHRYIKPKTSKKVCRDMLLYSFPLIFSVLSWWINKASDRYILTWIAGVSVSGVYAVAYKIPHLLTMFQNVFSQAWSISAVKEFDRKDSDNFIRNMYSMMNTAMVLICSGIMILDIPLAKILYARDFFEAWKFVPPLLISVVFNAMSLFLGSIFTAVKDTKTLSISTIIGAVVNTVCNFLFIPLWGAYGAAIATLIGYIVIFIMRRIAVQKCVELRIGLWRDVIAYGLLILQMVIAFTGTKLVLLQILILMILILLYLKEQKALVKSLIQKVNR